MKIVTYLCGGHMAFYACLCRADRKVPSAGAGGIPAKANVPYRCLADEKTFLACPNRDHDGSKHAAAGIPVDFVRLPSKPS